MADMDLDDLLTGPNNAPSTRPSRFAPKLKPRPKTEPSESLPPPDCVEPLFPVEKKEELEVEPDAKLEYESDAIEMIEMDVEVKPSVKDEEEDHDDLMEAAQAADDGTESDDVVVREIDVYYTASVDPKTKLYVLQYPLRPLWRPYELEERCEEVRVKPESAQVEIDLAVDVDSKNYDAGADARVQMKKQTLTASWKPPHVSGYAVGVLTGNKLHLNPVHAVVQLRPSMQHLESRESKRKTEEPQERKPSSSKKLSKMSEQTKDREEDWVPLKYHSARSDMTSKYLQKMMAQEGFQIDFSMSSYDYLNSLCPGTSNDSFSSKGPSIRFLLTLPLKERLRTWFLEGPPVHRFDALNHLAPDESVEEVLGVLQEHARLVQGLWVPKSSLVYGTDQGIEVLARDYVLLLFSKNVIITKSQFPYKAAIENAMKKVLELDGLAVKREAFKDWKLKELPDFNFIKSNPDLVKNQEEEWECMEKNINELISVGKNGHSVKSNTSNNPTTSRSSSNVAARTPRGSSSRAAMSEGDREVITRALQKFFRSVKICRFQQISPMLRDMAVTELYARGTRGPVTAANSIADNPDELLSIFNQVAVNIHGICVPRSSPDNPQYDPFRKVVIDLLIAEGPNGKLKKASIVEAAKMELKREVSQNEFQKVVNELCSSQGSAWILKSPDSNSKR